VKLSGGPGVGKGGNHWVRREGQREGEGMGGCRAKAGEFAFFPLFQGTGGGRGREGGLRESLTDGYWKEERSTTRGLIAQRLSRSSRNWVRPES